jgi:probable addiction module antidote protein
MPRRKLKNSALIQDLTNTQEAAEYLNTVLEDGDRNLFLVALKDIALAHGGVTALAKKTKLSRPSLYRMLSGDGNPELSSLEKLLAAFGLRISINSIEAKKRAS